MFYFALARELHMTVNQLLCTTTALELVEWLAYFRALETVKTQKEAGKMTADVFNGFQQLMAKQQGQ